MSCSLTSLVSPTLKQFEACLTISESFLLRRRGDRMSSRREFITLIGGAAAAWPLAVRAQEQERSRLPTVGFVGVSTLTAQAHLVAAFRQRLRELAWIEGRTIEIEYRWAEGREERYGEIAAEFVRSKVDVIFTHGTQAATAAKQTTSMIPIVAAVVGDPVGTGLVASLAQPGGNVTALPIVSPPRPPNRPRCCSRPCPLP